MSSNSPRDRANSGQVSPFDKTQTLTLDLGVADPSKNGRTSVLRIAAIAEDPNPAQYLKRTEYWKVSADLLRKLASGQELDLIFVSEGKDDDAIQGFFDGMPGSEIRACNQVGAQWSKGPAHPVGVAVYTFSTPDPDDADRPLAFSVWLNGEQELVGVSWHKAAEPEEYAWEKRPESPARVVLTAGPEPFSDFWHVHQKLVVLQPAL
jgi:hypothetical protein